jgi:hypothetical protein
LHLERSGIELRFHDPEQDRRLRAVREQIDATEAETALLRTETARINAETRAWIAEAENERRRQGLAMLRRPRLNGA